MRTQPLLLASIDALMQAFGSRAAAHRTTLQAGRTQGQHALPISFGFKLAALLAEIRRYRPWLIHLGKQAFVKAMGGAVSTYAKMSGKGCAVQASVGELLGLGSRPELAGIDILALPDP
jgi:3-carboxy-cis,cis-muconate cycloisomerase